MPNPVFCTAPSLPCEHTKEGPSDCLAVEDAPAGLTSAHTAGCATLALLTTHQRDDLDADLVTNDLTGVQIDHKATFHASVVSTRSS